MPTSTWTSGMQDLLCVYMSKCNVVWVNIGMLGVLEKNHGDLDT